jgi:ABC-2 type transport system ATP-binding protein
VLFLDEPTVGLDPRIRAELLDVIAGLRDKARTTILLTTHYLDEAERLCDRLAIIHEGEIVGLAAPAELRAELGEKLVELRVADDARLALDLLRASAIAGDDAFTVGSTITIPLHGRSATEAIAAIETSGVATTSITSRPPTLDDVYLRLTGGQLEAAA